MTDWDGTPGYRRDAYRQAMDWSHAGEVPQIARLPYQTDRGYGYPSPERQLGVSSDIRRPLPLAPPVVAPTLHHDFSYPVDAPGLGVLNPGVVPNRMRLAVPCQGCRRARVYCDKIQPCERCRRLGLPCLPQIKKRQNSRASDPAPYGGAPAPPGLAPQTPDPVFISSTISSTRLLQFVGQHPHNAAMDAETLSGQWVGAAASQSLSSSGNGALGASGQAGGWAGAAVPHDVLLAASIVQALAERSGRQLPSVGAHRGSSGQTMGRGGVGSRGQHASGLPWDGGSAHIAVDTWRRRRQYQEARLQHGTGGASLRLKEESLREGGLTWSEMCCRAILRLRARGAMDQAKMDFVRARAGAFRLTETAGGRELLRVLGDSYDWKSDVHRADGAKSNGRPVSAQSEEDGRGLSGEKGPPPEDEACVQWAEEVLLTPSAYTFHLPFLFNDQMICNAHMEADIVTTMELQELAEEAKVCPVFAPAWLIHRASLYDFATATILAVFGKGQRQEHHAIVKLVRRSGDCIRCLCTQRSFQGPDDGVCRLLAMRFWPLAHMFDFRSAAKACSHEEEGGEEKQGEGTRRGGGGAEVSGRWREL